MKRMLAGLGLALLVIGVPVLLLGLYGPPFIPDIDLGAAEQILSAPLLSPDSVLHAIGLLTWALWAYLALVVSLRVAAFTILRRNLRASSKLLSLTGRLAPSSLMKLVDFAVGGALLLVPIAPNTVATAIAALPPEAAHYQAMSEPHLAPMPTDEIARGGTSSYLVRVGDSLWGIAEHHLGTGERWQEIFEMNKGRLFPDGRVLNDPRLIRPNWILWLPLDQPGSETQEADRDPRIPTKNGRKDVDAAWRGTSGPATPSSGSSSASPNGGLHDDAGDTRDLHPADNGVSHEEGDDEVQSALTRDDPTVKLPSGVSLTASFAAGILTSQALAALHRRRRFRPDQSTIELEHEPELLAGLKAAGTSADSGGLEAAVEELVEAWRGSVPDWPRVLAAVESQTKATFLLEAPEGNELLLQSNSRVRFQLLEGLMQAEVAKPFAGQQGGPCPGTGPFVPLGITADGQVVHINLSTEGSIAIEGEKADRLAENWLVHCATSRSPQDLEVFQLGDLAGSHAALPHIRSSASWSEGDEALHRLQVEILGRARLFGQLGVSCLRDYLAAEPEEFVPTLVVVSAYPPPELIGGLESIASQARRMGIGFLAVGWTPSESGIKVKVGSDVEIESNLPIQGPLVPSLLDEQHLHEVVRIIRAANPIEEEPALVTELDPSAPDGGGSSTMGDSKSRSVDSESALDLKAIQEPSVNGKAGLQAVDSSRTEDSPDTVQEVATFEPKPRRGTGLEVRCLGTMSVTRDGTPIGTGWFKRSKELLAYLVANSQGAPKDRILDVFFPDLEPKQAERLLRDAIYYVRRQALAEGEATWSDSYLTRVGQNIMLGQDEWWADAWEYETLIAQAAQIEGPHAARLLRRALELYQGDFCDDAYFSWLEPVRERYRRLFLKGAVRLAELLAAGDDPEGAIEALERGIEVDPYCEDLYRRLIELEGSEGRVNAAEQHYQKLAKILAEELGVEPEPKTMELMSRLTRSRRQIQAR